MDFLKRVVKTKTFWTGLGTLAGGIYLVVGGNPAEGAVMISTGVGMIVGRDAIAKMADSKAAKGILLAVCIPMLGGCASMQGNGLGGGILDALEAAGKGALEDANVKKHLFDFLHDAGDLLFGDDAPVEVPTDTPSEPNAGGSDETSVASEG